MLRLLIQFLLPFNGNRPWLGYFGLAAMLLVLPAYFVSVTLAYALVVGGYILLLGLPLSLMPMAWRALISNRQLMLVHGFARSATAAAFVCTLLQAVWLTGFAALLGVSGSHWRETLLLFVNASAYMLVMQYAVTTRWAVVALSFLPPLSMAVLLIIMNGVWRRVTGDGLLLTMTLVCVLLWALTWWRVGTTHRFRTRHASALGMKDWHSPRLPLAGWLLSDNDSHVSATASLVLGYPASLASRLCVLSYNVFVGPLVATLFLGVVNLNNHWEFHPTLLDILIATSVFPATLGAFQNVDWVARLRLLWLHGRLQRQQLWQVLEHQLLINIGLLLLLGCALTAADMLWGHLPTALMLHYPLLVLCFNAFYSYYMVGARLRNWSTGWGLLSSFVVSWLVFGAVWFFFRTGSAALLWVLEAAALAGAVALRPSARRLLVHVDWLVVKPLRLAKLAN